MRIIRRLTQFITLFILLSMACFNMLFDDVEFTVFIGFCFLMTINLKKSLKLIKLFWKWFSSMEHLQVEKACCFIALAVFLPIISFGQSIVGQAVFTEAQRDMMNTRLDNQGLYVDTNANGSGFFGDGDMIYYGAERFQANPILRWTYMSTAVPIADYQSNNYEPLPQNTSGCPTPFSQTGECIDYVHYAAIISYIWNGRSDVVTFNGVSQSKDAHAQDLAENVWDVIVDAHNRTELDFSDTNRWVRNGADGNPHFQAMAKMTKFLGSYAIVHDQLTGYSNYTNNVSSVEQWFADCADFAYQRNLIRANNVFGSSWQNFANNSFNNSAGDAYGGSGNHQSHTHFASNGSAIGYEVSNAQASGINNRWLDFADYVGIYGVHFNNTFYNDYVYNVYRLVMMVGVFPDGTYNEWYRSYDTNPTVGFAYATLSIAKLCFMAYQHAVAVQNGLPGATDIGKFLDYTTSIGTDELYSNYQVSSTSGGNKNLQLVLQNLSGYYRDSSDGGFLDTRFAEGGNSMDIPSQYRPYTMNVAMVNAYFNSTTLENYWKLNTANGYNGMGNVANGTARNAGPFTEGSLGLSWNVAGAVYGGYFGQGDTENVTFSQTATPTCSDGIQNGDETGVDCGGSCAPCSSNPPTQINGNNATQTIFLINN